MSFLAEKRGVFEFFETAVLGRLTDNIFHKLTPPPKVDKGGNHAQH